jgi:hypothetical protein
MTEQGVVMTTVTWGANLTEKSIAVPLGAAKAARDEVFRATFSGVDWLEGITQSSFKIVREVLKRVDKLSQEVVDGLELVAGSVSRVIRGSSEAAGEMVSRTATTLTATNEPSQKSIVVPSA